MHGLIKNKNKTQSSTKQIEEETKKKKSRHQNEEAIQDNYYKMTKHSMKSMKSFEFNWDTAHVSKGDVKVAGRRVHNLKDSLVYVSSYQNIPRNKRANITLKISSDYNNSEYYFGITTEKAKQIITSSIKSKQLLNLIADGIFSMYITDFPYQFGRVYQNQNIVEEQSDDDFLLKKGDLLSLDLQIDRLKLMWSKNGKCIYNGPIDKKYQNQEFCFFVGMEGEGTGLQIVENG